MVKDSHRKNIENLTSMVLEISKKVDDSSFRVERI